MIEDTRAGVHDTHTVVFRAKGQDGVLAGTMLLDGLGSRGDRPLCVPTFVDAWPKAV